MSLDVGATQGGSRRRRPFSSPASAERRSDDYYDDDDDEASESSKAHPNHVYRGACSLGRFLLNPCLCLYTSLRLCCVSTQQPLPRRLRHCLCGVGQRGHLVRLFLLFVCGIYYFMKHLQRDTTHYSLRHASDNSVDRLPVVLGLFDVSRADSLGGWDVPSPQKFPSPPESLTRVNISDFGGLIFTSLRHSSHFRREVSPDDDVDYEFHRKRCMDEMDKVFLGESHDHDEELESQKCRRPNWRSLYFSNCNAFHEIDLSREYKPKEQEPWEMNYDSYIFNHGYYRDAWMLANEVMRDAIVLKTSRAEHDIGRKTMEKVQRDGIVMERLTSSPRIMNMYGLCGSSIMVQALPYNVEEYVIPGDGYAKQKDLDDKEDVKPRNIFTPTEKLEMALEMAESIADLHGYKGGVIVHDDIQLVQWMRTSQDQLVLGDFNRAEIMNWNEKKGEYCTYENGGAYGNYRAPEEMADWPLNEKIDVFSMGNNIYGLLTGLWPFYENEDDEVVQKKVIGGKRGYIDKRYRTRSFAEGKLVEIMERCWEQKPSDRADIFEVVRFLRDAVLENKRLNQD